MSQHFGLFSICQQYLALTLEALQEVVPLSTLTAVPFHSSRIRGGLNLRGMIIPVLDLADDLPSDCRGTDCYTNIVVIRCGSYMFGILTEEIIGVAEIDPQRIQTFASDDQADQLFSAGFCDPAMPERYVSILDIEQLQKTPGLVRLETLRAESSTTVTGHNQPAPEHIMFVLSHGIPLALNTRHIRATLMEPEILEVEYPTEILVGEFNYNGQLIPVIRLGCFLNLERQPGHEQQAFIVNAGDGMVACLVDGIIDVMTCQLHCASQATREDNQFRDLPFFRTTVRTADLSTHNDDRLLAEHLFYIVLNDEKLATSPDILSLARTCRPEQTSTTGKSDPSRYSGRSPRTAEDSNQRLNSHSHDPVLMYQASFPVLSAVSQIIEILPLQLKNMVFLDETCSRGLINHKGHSVPVFCLSQLLGNGPLTCTDTSSVLLTQVDGGLAGFSVSELIRMDSIRWQKQIGSGLISSPPPQISLPQFRHCWSMCRLEHDPDAETHFLLDLEQLARLALGNTEHELQLAAGH